MILLFFAVNPIMDITGFEQLSTLPVSISSTPEFAPISALPSVPLCFSAAGPMSVFTLVHWNRTLK